MVYMDKLLKETDYLQQLELLEQLEKDRQFCRHGLEHLLDTARLIWIRCLEGRRVMDKEMVYLTALLHDLGRIDQYEKGIPHHEAGAERAGKLLGEIGYPAERIRKIQEAILGHRGSGSAAEVIELSALLCWADQRSRMCFVCRVREACNWREDQKNETITD